MLLSSKKQQAFSSLSSFATSLLWNPSSKLLKHMESQVLSTEENYINNNNN